jgi:guanidinoacetate N-methyltransferase
MEDWQIPVMHAMADSVTESRGDILEIGIGRGIASDFIQANQPKSHTLVECNDGIFANMVEWKKRYPDRAIHLLHGMWQDCISADQRYDGILFHTYPLSEQEFVENVVQGVTFAEHFFELAGRILNPGGTFTYLSNESDSLSRAHQRALFKHFDSVNLSVIEDLDIPANSQDSLWSREIVHVVAGKSVAGNATVSKSTNCEVAGES